MIELRHSLLFAGLGLLSLFPAAAKPASVASISTEDLLEFAEQPEEIRQLITTALSLTGKKLTYTFGSNSPANSGMDCSGTVQFALKSIGMEAAPRSSYQFYQWVKAQGELKETRGVETTEDPAFDPLKPGDLLFWEGTYDTGKTDPPISHVMIYLGTLKADGKGVVFGASDGRRFRGKKITGVSVFDWRVPPSSSTSKFVGFAPIPDLVKETPVVRAAAQKANEQPLKSLKSGLEKLFKKRETSQ